MPFAFFSPCKMFIEGTLTGALSVEGQAQIVARADRNIMKTFQVTDLHIATAGWHYSKTGEVSMDAGGHGDEWNLLNNRNVRWMDSSGKIGGELGDPSAYYDPRRIRIGAKLEF